MSKFGHNLGFIDELYRNYLADPGSVSEAWREFFKDYTPEPGRGSAPTPVASPAAGVAVTPAPPADAEPLRGASARIVDNMTDSLAIPTATSVRTIPVKLLEENRRIINQHQSMAAGPRISFTHILAWAVVRALVEHPRMNAKYEEIDGKPHLLPRTRVNLGLAIDIEKRGERVLLVPNIPDAASLDFPSLVAAYDDLVQRSRKSRLTVEDFEGTSVTLTNPGMLGTVLSVPRLMRGQGTIIGVGSIGYPAEYSGMSPEVIADLGLSKVMSVTSTYDHRVIQGAESGQFLLTLERLLQGDHRFYQQIFGDLGVPQEPIAWAGDQNPQVLGSGGSSEAIAKQAGVLQLIRAYRVRGHIWADLDPMGYTPEAYPELELSHYGLSVWDLDRRFIAGGLGGRKGTLPLRDILETLQLTYCRHVGVEYMHIQDTEPRHWLQERLEDPANAEPLPRELQIQVLKKLNAAEAFETFLHTNYIGQKRFSLEGAETLIPMLDVLLRDAADAGVEECVMGMAHRGRLNVLSQIVGKSYGQIFREFEGIDPESTHGSGDVKYHLGASGTYESPGGNQLRVVLSSNPSHLEAVNPVVEGMTRARQEKLGDTERERVLPVLIHGDAAFAGQGVVAETLNLSKLRGYRTGGTVHIVVNNQIGFTTGPSDARSSRYPTDVAKMVHAPIFHVNGDHPQSCVRVMRHALAFRQAFKCDVVIDLFCYRRWGHNEADDPSYTHPILYSRIEGHRSVRKRFTERLVRRGDFDIETAEQALEDFRGRLRDVHDEVRRALSDRTPVAELAEDEDTARPGDGAPSTAVPDGVLRRIVAGLGRTPPGFNVHPKLARQLAQRELRYSEDRIDWALAEALAFGSVAVEGVPVRLSGEDSGRGTFSQRHATLYDHETAEPYVPLAHLDPEQAPFAVFDSLLSEFAVLGFEYGYSVQHPEALVIWEAQFGDFVNGAQVIIDQFIVSAASKWNQASGLVMLLPHGYEGQGPEHSSAKLERFLQLCAQRNIRVAYPSTPSQYFHLLRFQARFPVRKPLVLMTPKSLLRHPACVSSVAELSGGSFRSILPDSRLPGGDVRRVVLCSGKVFYDLDAARTETGADGIAIFRLEQLYPFPADDLSALLGRFPAADLVWVQEEQRNMGAWGHVRERLAPLLSGGRSPRYVGRPASASTATGSAKRHVAEQEAVVEEALAPG